MQLRRAVREAAESKLRNGVIDTNDLLRKITEGGDGRHGTVGAGDRVGEDDL